MKHFTTRIMSMLLCVALLLSAAACGRNGGSVDLDGNLVESDVREYLNSFVDANAEITSLNQSKNNISQTQTEVTCHVVYSANSGDASFDMIMLYEQNSGNWSLVQCDTQFDEVATAGVTQAQETSQNENAVLQDNDTDAGSNVVADAPPDYATKAELTFSSITEAEAMESLEQFRGAPMLKELCFIDMIITDELMGYLFGSDYSSNPFKLCFEQCTIEVGSRNTYKGKITQLVLRDCELDNEPKWINQITTLTNLAVTNTEDTDYSFSTLNLSALDCLEELDLSGTDLIFTLSEAVVYPETPEPFVFYVDATLDHAKERGTFMELINLGVAAGSYPFNCDFVFSDGETYNPSL